MKKKQKLIKKTIKNSMGVHTKDNRKTKNKKKLRKKGGEEV